MTKARSSRPLADIADSHSEHWSGWANRGPDCPIADARQVDSTARLLKKLAKDYRQKSETLSQILEEVRRSPLNSEALVSIGIIASKALNQSAPTRVDMFGRPCRVELVHLRKDSWIGHVHVGNAIHRSTRTHSSKNQAEESAERWLAKYLEVGSWTEATEWHEKHYYAASP